jgi:ABC-type glycerol-3-phosphate transport system permease component
MSEAIVSGRSGRRKGLTETLWLSLGYLVIGVFTVLMIGPFLWGVLTSFLPRANLFDLQIELSALTGANYSRLFMDTQLPRWFLNTAIVTVGIVGTVTFLSALGGYVFATREFPGKKLLFALVLMFLMIPVQVVLIPMFLEMKWLHLTDSYLGLIIPYAGSAFGVFLLTQFMKTIPPSLIASAKIDGAGEFRIIFQIMIPLCMPALASLAIIKFNFAWNDFIWPLVIIRSPEMRTLPLGIALLHGRTLTDWSLIMSAVVISTLPVILLTLFFQRYFVRGVATSGLK